MLEHIVLAAVTFNPALTVKPHNHFAAICFGLFQTKRPNLGVNISALNIWCQCRRGRRRVNLLLAPAPSSPARLGSPPPRRCSAQTRVAPPPVTPPPTPCRSR